MRLLFSLFILVTSLLIQLHGLTHSYSDKDHSSHRCAICEIQGQNVAIEPSQPQWVSWFLSPFETVRSVPLFVQKSQFPSKNIPRAPPFFS